MPATEDQTIRAGSAFSPFKAAMVAAVWAWAASIVAFFMFDGFALGGWRGIAGHFADFVFILGWVAAIQGVLCVAAMLVLIWPLAVILQNNQRWWLPSATCPMAIILGIFVLIVSDRIENHFSDPKFSHDFEAGVFAWILVFALFVGTPAALAVSCYYRRTHPPRN